MNIPPTKHAPAAHDIPRARSVSSSGRMRSALLLLALCASSWPTTHARAQSRVELDARAYLARVEQDAALILASPERRAAALATREVARRRPMPSLTAGLAQLDVSGEGAPTASLLAVDLPIEFGGDRSARLREADARIALTSAELDLEIRGLLRAAASAYVDASAAAALVAARENLLLGFERATELEELRLSRGEITEAQALRTMLERDRAELELRAARAALATSELALGRFLFDDEAISVVATDTLAAEHEAHDPAVLERLASEQNPWLRTAERRLALARAMRARIQADRIVDPTLRLEWQHNGSTTEPQFRQRSNDTLALLLTIPFPITAPRRAELAVADAEIAAAEARLEAMRHRLGIEVRVAIASEDEARARAHDLDTTMRERARALVQATMAAYERDGATAFELVAARRALEEVELARVEALANLARAHLAVEASVHAPP